MIVTCQCQHCNKPLEFEAENAGKKAVCPECGAETTLCLPSQKAPQAADTVPPKRDLTPLQLLRRGTAYIAGRNLAAAYLVGSIIAVPVALLTTSDEPWAFPAFLASLGNVFVAWLLREVIRAVFDAADCALKQAYPITPPSI